jgi:amino acid adenylation domain-containing protein
LTLEHTNDGANDAGCPLSFAQERLWLEYLLEPESPVYNLMVCLRLRGKVDVGALERSLTEIVRRHDILRTCIDVVDEEPRQRVGPPATVRLATTDLDEVPGFRRWERAMELVSEEVEKPFNLRDGPVFRASLIRLGEAEHVFLFVVHHIAFDGWSRDVFLSELGVFYDSATKGDLAVLPSPPITYAQFALWQRELAESGALIDALAYWRELLADDPQFLDLPTDYPQPKVRSSQGHTRVFRIPSSADEQLRLLARSESTTPYVVLLAAFVALLHRYTEQDDIVIGTPVVGRTRFDLEESLGFFVNTIPLRVRVGADPSFRELVGHARSVAMGALAHQEVPLEKLTEELHLARDPGRTPLFRLMFTLETFAPIPATMGDLETEWVDIYTETAKFDLTLTVKEAKDGLLAVWEYSTELFAQETVQRVADHFTRLLEYAVNHPDARLSELPLLSEKERQTLLIDWNATTSDYPRQSRIHEVFEEQVVEYGQRAALTAAGKAMTYTELNQSANQLARWLSKLHVDREVPVGLCLSRSLEMVVATLGILKAGGVYVPIDPEYPQERIRYILEDTGTPIVITDSSSARNVPGDGRRVLCLDLEWEQIQKESAENLGVKGQADDLAYVMYTSGSTGKPKGVCVVHRGVVRLVKGSDYASFGPDEVFLQLAPFTFDVSTFEIWGALLNGGRLVIGPTEFPTHAELGRIIRDEQVSTLWLTAGLFHNVVDAGLEALAGLRQVLAGGDVVSAPHGARFKSRYPDCRLIDGYGPTENTTFTTCYEISGKETGSVPIGRPIANTTAYVLDSRLDLVPIGVVGELCTGGDGLARGYLNDPDLTKERFVAASAAGQDCPVLYRTGDMARYRADGVIEFLGRKDNQVKINGFRVETEEVEEALRGCPGVVQASVVARPSPGGDKRLVAYCVPEPAADLTVAHLRSYLQEHVPAYMIPSSFVVLAELPLNPQGKVDRRALPEPGQGESADATPPVEPRDPLESLIASIWKRLFVLDSIGIRDNFFDLGGHSLLAFRFLAALEKSTGVQLPLSALFEAPTVEQLAAIMWEKGWQPLTADLVPIKPGGSRPPIFFVHNIYGDVLAYYGLARSLSPDQPVFGLKARGLDGKESPLSRVEDMAELYVNEIMAFQPHGPYALGGLSFGGIVAFEMARRLVDRGEPVMLVALLDAFISGQSSLSRARFHARSLLRLPLRNKVDHIRRAAKNLRRRVRSRYWQMIANEQQQARGSVTAAQRSVTESILFAASQYTGRKHTPHSYAGRVTVFVADDRTRDGFTDPVEQWKKVAAGGVEAIKVPGNHSTLVSEPHVRVLAQRLDECLERASRTVPVATESVPR